MQGKNLREFRARARELRREQTPSEEALWDLLRDRSALNLKFRRQHLIGPYVADFYCHELKLIVELDGGVHHDPSQAAHDQNRDANLTSLGYKILRFANEDIHENPQTVLDRIAGTVKGRR